MAPTAAATGISPTVWSLIHEAGGVYDNKGGVTDFEANMLLFCNVYEIDHSPLSTYLLTP